MKNRITSHCLMAIFCLSPALAFAGALCPPDSCNPYNGCMDGCSLQEITCSPQSDAQCAGKTISSPCQWSVEGESGQGYCSAEGAQAPYSCWCG